ncbi:hypothetical protein KGY77_08110 [Candidatus Bipolaricaulota bacterium]|nr:hypothetical protein [Candidatus Bipolaricaulota bacterium]
MVEIQFHGLVFTTTRLVLTVFSVSSMGLVMEQWLIAIQVNQGLGN